MTTPVRLAGITILVTRPIHQAAALAEGIRAAGGNPYLFPVLEITDIPDPTHLIELVHRLEQFNWAIFVSPNAVEKAMNLINKHGEFPIDLKVAAVGKGSAAALKQHGIADVLIPNDQFDSESLLKSADLQNMTNQRVVIFRGRGGRQLLGETLSQRGATVEYAECYLRKKPSDMDTTTLMQVWSTGKIDAVIITSSEGLHNLFDIIGTVGQQLLKNTPVFTVHARIAQIAKELGLKKIVQTTSDGDKGLLESLKMYFDS